MERLGFEKPVAKVEASGGFFNWEAVSTKRQITDELSYSVFFKKNELRTDNGLRNDKVDAPASDLSGTHVVDEKVTLRPISTWTKIRNFLEGIFK